MVRIGKKEYVLFSVAVILVVSMVFSSQLGSGSRYVAVYSGGSTLVSGYISENTTWTLTGSPYIVVGDVVVESGAFLTIEPGVVVKFTSGKSLVIDGGLGAHGNDTHEITFTSNSTTPAPADWVGIQVRSSAEYASFDHCIVEYATDGIDFGQIEVRYAFGTVTNSIIRSCYRGISTYAIPPCIIIIENTTISENVCAGLDSSSTTLIISNSNVSRNGPILGGTFYGGIISTSPIVAENLTISENNDWGIYGSGGSIKNSTISNNRNGISGLDEVSYSAIHDNTGVGLQKVNKILNCNITNNGFGAENVRDVIDSCVMYNDYGVLLGLGVQNGNILRSIISHNGHWGVKVTDFVHHTIELSNITHNYGTGIDVHDVTSLDAHHNNILDNFDYDFQNGGSTDLDATYNWWGTTNETLIEEHIYDYYDDYNVGKIFYKPYLTEPESIPAPLCPSPSEPYVSWYLNVHVIDSIGQNVPSAKVTATYPNATVSESKLTDANGWARLRLTDSYLIGNYTVTATYEVLMGQQSVNMTGNQEITIQLPLVIPEFPTFLILPLFMIATLLALVAYRRKHS